MHRFQKEFFCNDSNWNYEKSSFSKYGNSLVFRMEKNLSEPYLDCFMLNPNGKDHVSLILPVHGAQTDLSITTSEIYTI